MERHILAPAASRSALSLSGSKRLHIGSRHIPIPTQLIIRRLHSNRKPHNERPIPDPASVLLVCHTRSTKRHNRASCDVASIKLHEHDGHTQSPSPGRAGQPANHRKHQTHRHVGRLTTHPRIQRGTHDSGRLLHTSIGSAHCCPKATQTNVNKKKPRFLDRDPGPFGSWEDSGRNSDHKQRSRTS